MFYGPLGYEYFFEKFVKPSGRGGGGGGGGGLPPPLPSFSPPPPAGPKNIEQPLTTYQIFQSL